MVSTETGGSSVGKADRYEWRCTLPETRGLDAATWGVCFNVRPSKYHLRGHAAWWKRVCALRDGARRGLCDPAHVMNELANGVRGEVTYEDSDVEDDDEAPTQPQPRVLSDENWLNIFATVNGHCIRVYLARHGRRPTLLRSYRDEDDTEVFYAVRFVYNADNKKHWWVLAAGAKGVVRVLDLNSNELVCSLVGHGEAVNDIVVHPRDPALVVTASKDESLRMWNLRLGSSVAVFAGLKGHRGEVLSADFDRYGNNLASCGIDNSVRVWHITKDDAVVDAILESHRAADRGSEKFMYTDDCGKRKTLKVPISQFPSFVTRKVHKHYVDCVKWVGHDVLLSKSVHNRVYLWQLKNKREALAQPASEYKLLEEYVVDNCNVWFVKFGVDRKHRVLACGNESGLVYVYHLDVLPPKKVILEPRGRKTDAPGYVRQCAFSEDGSILVGVDDTSHVLQFERVEDDNAKLEAMEVNVE